MKNINLCEILKGHKGETFYSPFYGDIKVDYIEDTSIGFSSVISKNDVFCVDCNGFVIFNDTATGPECIVFPSKDQRDWEEWDKEQKPKTWDKLIKVKDIFIEVAEICSKGGKDLSKTYCNTPIEKSALSFLKLYHLIEEGYGGNVTNEEWYNDLIPKFIIVEKSKNRFKPVCVRKFSNRTPIAFHTEEQAEEFLGNPENIKLLQDYYIVL